MAVPYVFANLPASQGVPLAWLDDDFAYILDSPTFSGDVVIGGDLGVGVSPPNNSAGYTTISAGGAISNTDGSVEANYSSGAPAISLYATKGASIANDFAGIQSFDSAGTTNYFIGYDGDGAGYGGYFSVEKNQPLSFWTNSIEQARITADGKLLIGTTTSGASKLTVADDSIQINSSKTPSTAGATGTTGQICWDSSYIYVCVAANTWKRAAIASWP